MAKKEKKRKGRWTKRQQCPSKVFLLALARIGLHSQKHVGRGLGFPTATRLQATVLLPIALPLSPPPSPSVSRWRRQGRCAGYLRPDCSPGARPWRHGWELAHRLAPPPPASWRGRCGAARLLVASTYAPAFDLFRVSHGRTEVFHQFMICVFQCNEK